MAEIPEPLIVDILSRLPVKSLLRFRCVAKWWLALIDSVQFMKLHLSQSLKNYTNLAVIMRGANYYTVDFATMDQPVEHDLPLRTKDVGGETLGSCDGLVCLQCFSPDKVEGIVVYNPATRDCRPLAGMPSIEYPICMTWVERMTYGFGYDQVNEDYKLVRIFQFACVIDGLYESQVLVYSVKEDIWRKTKHFPMTFYLSYERCNGVFVNGHLHWIVTCGPKADGSKLIVAFNLSSEDYDVVPQPMYGEGDFQVNVGVLRGCLYVMCNHPRVKTDIWVCKEYGVEESWMKAFSVPQPEAMGNFNYVRPLAYSVDGSRVLLERDARGFVWFDLQRQAGEAVSFPNMCWSLEGEMLVESLVPIDRLTMSRNKTKPTKKPAKKRDNLDSFLAKGFKLKL